MVKRVSLGGDKPKKKSKRVKPQEPEQAGIYFTDPTCDFFTTGCTPLDMALGGGWVENRVINIVGDKSTGKTLQAIEASANYHEKYPDAEIHYAEAEAAFDKPYAQSLGMPVSAITFPEVFTVEDLFNDLNKLMDKEVRALYIVDSLDALSDSAEMERGITDGTFGASKAKQLSQMFRRLNQRLSKANVTIIVVSQVRDNIGAMFGKKHTRSGGKALDFYCSQVVWLTHLKRHEKTRNGVTRPYGIQVRAMVEKNKVGMPFRKVDYPIHFAFGVEDVIAGVEWLIESKCHQELFGSVEKAKKFLKTLDKLTDEEYEDERKAISESVKKHWRLLETEFLPTRRKYRG